ncbi:hypothetical protein FRX31_018823 [Thalictrum thalictroides]|uniref:KNOX2 domain-containing protein n=1 Tax=Thalictrum thalictroides TaxID=46969 RepID=A0A7J6W2I9_THATH|nr:hypothetical protein FRX31_018823 [Thalictrum thalictroides]
MSLLGDLEEADQNVVNEGHKKADTITSVAELPDLDHFMEAYCRVLGEFKEAMKKPLYGTAAFINDMHSQLKELTTTYSSYTTTPNSPGPEED